MSARRTTRPHLCIESLENRQMMAANLTASLTSGVLSIDGTHQGDTIVVRQIGNQISIDGVAGRFDASQVTLIAIDSKQGNDFIRLDVPGQEVTKLALIDAGEGNDVVRGGNGGDVVLLGSGNDLAITNGGNDIVDGGAGNDRIWTGAGHDVVDGGDNDDYIVLGAGDDTAFGGTGNDRVWSEIGNDQVSGGDGDDEIMLGAGGRRGLCRHRQ